MASYIPILIYVIDDMYSTYATNATKLYLLCYLITIGTRNYIKEGKGT